MHATLSVAIVDDDEIKRETLKDELEIADLIAKSFEGPFNSVDDLVKQVSEQADAAVCDHHLISNYAAFSGAAGVDSLYKSHIPAVLVTAYGKAEMIEIRRFRRRIPVLMTLREADPDALRRGWEVCRREFNGEYLPSRRPWRVLVRIEDFADSMVYAVLPGWNSDEVVKFPINLIASNLHPLVRPGERFFAQVNKGAEDQADLFFEDFEHGGS